MRLGLVVLYVVPEGYEGVFDLHLRRIERHTREPYTIYGTAIRCAPPVLDRLQAHPRVKLVPVPQADLWGSAEHSHYLDRLVAVAIEDGITHVLVMHIDSFPIRDGWVEQLTGHLSGRCALVTGEGIDSACLLFTREFYLACRPGFLPPPAVRDGPEVARCVAEWRVVPHTGIGYAFAAWRDGYTMHFLRPGRRADSTATVYESSVFHLGGGLKAVAPQAPARRALRSLRGTIYRAAGGAIRALSTPAFRARLRQYLAGDSLIRFDRNRNEHLRVRVREEMADLLADPNRYLADRWGAERI